jgi:hypothetical protein
VQKRKREEEEEEKRRTSYSRQYARAVIKAFTNAAFTKSPCD